MRINDVDIIFEAFMASTNNGFAAGGQPSQCCLTVRSFRDSTPLCSIIQFTDAILSTLTPDDGKGNSLRNVVK
jgi:hypothetical protein